MATLTLDLLDPAAYFDDGPDGVRACRVGLAEGLTATTTEALVESLTALGMPEYGDAFPGYSGSTVVRRVIRGTPDAGDKARVEIYYESPDFGGTPNNYFVVRDSTALTQELVEMDRDFDAIQVTYDGSQHTLRTPRLTPMRTLSIYAELGSRPSIAALGAVGCVNDQTWQGLPKGYWLCAGLEATGTDAVGAAAKYTATATFISRLYRDWSEYGFYIDAQGRIPTDISVANVKSTMAATYTEGTTSVTGFAKVGHYEMKDFQNIFGI